ncbi:type II toxin-antitoxin system VapC family toxin [Halorarius halobius]|uniref:type II toxin-antitoxin system VapC family toxin n=1 Tax=Halorarius halobius TaxID=2962671 RepID=UPI0020CE4EB1|nr:PIN domain-containing protein [Halorarius halobius]
MSQARPLFIDTNAFVALYDADDDHHEAANAVMDGIESGDLPYGHVFTSRFVLSETATTLRYGAGHREAVQALTNIRDSSTVNVLEVPEPLFDRTAEQFATYDDQDISFIDHMNAVLSADLGIDHIFAFEDDFATLGMTRVPVDTGEAP